MHRSMKINFLFYMFIILISMLLSFMSYFLNRKCLFSCFSLGGAFFLHNKNQIFYIHFFTVDIIHCVKSVHILSYSGLHFPAFGLNMERYSVSLHIRSEWGKIRTKITPNTDIFHAVIIIVGSCKRVVHIVG